MIVERVFISWKRFCNPFYFPFLYPLKIYRSWNGIEMVHVLKVLKNVWKVGQYIQKQPSVGVLMKRCSENMQQIYRRIAMSKCDFNKVVLELYWNRTSVWVFSSGQVLYILRTTFYKKTYGGLLLYLTIQFDESFYSKLRQHWKVKVK